MNLKDRTYEFGQIQREDHLVSHSSNAPSSTAAYGVLVLILIYYTVQYFDPWRLPLFEVIWNIFVWMIPAPLIARMDKGFETAMTEEREGNNPGFGSKAHASKSEAMRRVLGLDGTGLLTTVQRARTLSNLSSVFSSRPNLALPGLGNWDNSCYQNSVLQSLAALEFLPTFLEENTSSTTAQPTNTALRRIIAGLNEPENMGKTLWTPAELKSMSSWQQQDAQEYFSKISDELEKESRKRVRSEHSPGGLGQLPLRTKEARSCRMLESSPGTSDLVIDRTSDGRGGLPQELMSFIMRSPLEGLLAQRVGCQTCGFVEGLSLVPFNCLTVPLGRSWLYDVRSCLDEYTALEPINGVECAKCTLLAAKSSIDKVLPSLRDRNMSESQSPNLSGSTTQKDTLLERSRLVDQALDDEDFSDQALKRCQVTPKARVSTTKSRQAVIARAPKSLVIHINRSNFDEFTGAQTKNLASVRFPRHLNLAAWSLGRCPNSSESDSLIENWSTDPSESMLSNGDFENIDPDKNYQLRAVITHYGRHENGHYICYRKSPHFIGSSDRSRDRNEETWWRLSDEEVTEVDEEVVLSQGGVFMLFYEKMPQSPSLKSHQDTMQDTGSEDICDILSDDQPLRSEDLSVSEALTVNQTNEPNASGLLTPPPTPPQIPQTSPISIPTDNSGTAPEPESTAPVNHKSPSPESSISPKIADLSTSAKVVEPVSTIFTVPSADSTPQSPIDITSERTQPVQSPQPPQPVQPVSPASMRTAAPRSKSISGSRAGKAMGSVAGFVQAN